MSKSTQDIEHGNLRDSEDLIAELDRRLAEDDAAPNDTVSWETDPKRISGSMEYICKLKKEAKCIAPQGKSGNILDITTIKSCGDTQLAFQLLVQRA